MNREYTLALDSLVSVFLPRIDMLVISWINNPNKYWFLILCFIFSCRINWIIHHSFNPILLKADIQLLEREIKQRKQKFGVEVYDCMLLLEVDNEMPIEEKEQKIRQAFDRARKDIAVIQAKIECKKEEIAVLEAEMASSSKGMKTSHTIPPSSGTVVMSDHPGEMEYGFGGLPTRSKK